MRSITFRCFITVGIVLLDAGCGQREIRPVEIYPEDNCSNCRMAISDKSFASELITDKDEVMKFDDLSCLESYRKKNATVQIKAIFVMDYDSKSWLPFEKSVIVKTGIDTPMGSGKIAVKDSARAAAMAKEHPPTSDVSALDCCSSD
jgi:copper chaperone NosL